MKFEVILMYHESEFENHGFITGFLHINFTFKMNNCIVIAMGYHNHTSSK